MEDRTLLSTFLVNNTADSGPGSLRQAIVDSNAATDGANTIDFNITGQGVQTIAPLSALPAITQAVLIDGFSQPGYAGTPLIELTGSQLSSGDGLTITAANVTVRGLEIDSFYWGAGIRLTGTGATQDWVCGNFLGTDPTGTQAWSNNAGVEIDSGATDNLVGTNGDGVNGTSERNLLSGNSLGVWITGQGTTGNTVAGNRIGTDITRTVSLGNAYAGVQIDHGAANNTIGGLSTPDGVFHGFDLAPATSPAALSFQADLSGPPDGQTSGGPTAVYRMDMETGGVLLAIIHSQGFTARLMILDSQGRVLVQSDGLSPGDPDSVIDQYLAAGNYSLVVESTGGSGTYALTTTLSLASTPNQPIPLDGAAPGIVAGDFTGDGRTDLAVPNFWAGTVQVLLGNGDGTFQPPVSYAVGAYPYAIVAGDFTGDGRPDLAVVNSNNYGNGSGSVSVLLGNGDGTFQPQITYGVGQAPVAIVAGDFAGDGQLDLAVVNAGDNTVSVLVGNGDGTFQPQVTYAVGAYPNSIVAGDFTGVGRTDLAVVNQGTYLSAGTVSVLLGNGDGTFQPQVTYAVGAQPDAIVAGHLAGNGRTDLAVANRADNTVSVLLGKGDGTFQPQVTYAGGG